MSGITGIISLHHALTAPQDIEAMAKAIQYRGPDGSSIWRGDTAHLGMLYSGRKAGNGQGLLRQGTKTITADVRLDNRDELLSRLDLASETSDTELLLEAYCRWESDCVHHLLGDFAFAIWDEADHTLFCARDHFGIKPFYYHDSGGRFAFASESRALTALSWIPSEVDDQHILDTLLQDLQDKAITPYKGIYRLPPAHWLTVTTNGVRCERYWRLDPEYEIRLASDDEYAEAFLDLFQEAVRCRLRTDGAVGSLLSGGLDSSAVTCAAHNQLMAREDRLRTFSAIFPSVLESDESEFILSISGKEGIEPHFIRADEISPLYEIERVLRHMQDFFIPPNSFMLWRLFEAAQGTGIKVMLTGADGDSTVSHGFGTITGLAYQGRWSEVHRLIDRLHKQFASFGDTESALINGYALPAVSVHTRQLHLIHALRDTDSMHRILGRSRRQVLERGIIYPLMERLGLPIGRAQYAGIMNTQHFSAQQVGRRQQQLNQSRISATSERNVHYNTLNSGLLVLSMELMDRLAAAMGMEARHPFFDKRLVEYCLALPPEQKLREGWSRFVFRKAMAGILPETIQWRSSKSNLEPNFNRSLKRYEAEHISALLRDNMVNPYLDMAAVRLNYERYIATDNSQDALVVWLSATLLLWLKQANPQAD